MCRHGKYRYTNRAPPQGRYSGFIHELDGDKTRHAHPTRTKRRPSESPRCFPPCFSMGSLRNEACVDTRLTLPICGQRWQSCGLLKNSGACPGPLNPIWGKSGCAEEEIEYEKLQDQFCKKDCGRRSLARRAGGVSFRARAALYVSRRG